MAVLFLIFRVIVVIPTSGSNCADAKLYTIDAGIATSLGGRKNGVARVLPCGLKRHSTRRTLMKMRLNAAVKLDRDIRSIGGPHITAWYEKVESLERSP